MGVTKPLFYGNNILKEFTDAELDYLSYSIRVAYVNELLASDNVPGKISLSNISNYSLIGTAADRYRNIATQTRPNDSLPAPGTDSNPNTIGALDLNLSVTTYYFFQHNVIPTYPSTSLLNSNSYITFDTTTNNLKIAGGTENDIASTVIEDVKNQIKSGDELGSYRISLSAPTNGTWNNITTAFIDTRYLENDVTFYLYLKVSNETSEIPAESTNYPLRYDDSITFGKRLKQMEMSPTSNLVQNVFLPILKRNYPVYALTSTPPTGTQVSKGTIIDKYYSDTTTTVTGSTTYTRIDTPNVAGTVATNNFYLIIE